MKTKTEIAYKSYPCGFIAVIPKGTPVALAYNLPGNHQFWVEPWGGMSDRELSWLGNYGFLLNADEVEES